MSTTSATTMKMPELLVFARALLLGAVLFETFWVAWLAGGPFGQWLQAHDGLGFVIVICIFTAFIVGAYARKRRIHDHAKRVYESRRFDLLLFTILGAAVGCLLEPQLSKIHAAVSRVNVGWAPLALAIFLATLVSPMWRELIRRKRPDTKQMYFLVDAEIKDAEQDVLDVKNNAKEFADTVLTSGARSGLVFGIDAPWGVGKTSFLNLAKKRWEDVAGDEVIVFTFEPLRYASEPDLSERFIKDLSAAIRQKAFAPEFFPAATRYSRMLKGKTDFSVLGVKLSFEPSSETIDDLLDDIDDLLKQIDRRLIVIVDDLDRLDSKLVNNVLFTVRRTFKLTQATYILCYDTEMLVAAAGGKDEGARAREFLEKFITAKLTLFVDMKVISDYLGNRWETKPVDRDLVSATEQIQLRQLMKSVQGLLVGEDAHRYGPMLGNMRKVKRFVNAVLLMNLEKVNLDETDFNKRDLVHLILLHLYYPGLFRRIYGEETEGRVGSFGARQGDGSNYRGLLNGQGLNGVIEAADVPAKFLLGELFDVEAWAKEALSTNDETPWRTRACFNNKQHRNLERYLQLIVRLKVPEANITYRLYKNQLQLVKDGKLTVAEVLSRSDFALALSESPHDRFWALVVNHAHELSRAAADDAIETLVKWLPKYSSLQFSQSSMRNRAVVSLLLLLDRAGFGEVRGNGLPRDLADLPQLAERLIGNRRSPSSRSLVKQLVAPDRGALGWGDLMLMRLYCSADRQANVHNVYTALARLENPGATATGNVRDIAAGSMRLLSQRVFEEFKRTYIDCERNFFLDVDQVPEVEILGEGGRVSVDGVEDLEAALLSSRSGLKTFVIYQLVNDWGGNGDGVGCGRYDEVGSQDTGGIRRAMTEYLLGFCFDPRFGLLHACAFADFCLRSLNEAPLDLYNSDNDAGTQSAVISLLGREAMTAFWARAGDQLKKLLSSATGTVYGHNNFEATYAVRLPTVFLALDRLLVDSTSA